MRPLAVAPVGLLMALAAPSAKPPPRLFALATIPRIRVEAARDHVMVDEEINLPRGDWQGGDVDLFVAYGAPGVPRAMDATLLACGEAGGDPAPGATGESIALTRAPHRPANAFLLLGPSTMAGVVLHVRESSFRRATAATGVARIRLRVLGDPPAEDVKTGRELVVRLGSRGGEPLALGTLEIRSTEATGWLLRAEAHLCGPSADGYPLAVTTPAPRGPSNPPPGSIAPVLAVRHATDDLCLRYWTG